MDMIDQERERRAKQSFTGRELLVNKLMRKKAMELYTEEIVVLGRTSQGVESSNPTKSIEEHVKVFEDMAKVSLFKAYAEQKMSDEATFQCLLEPNLPTEGSIECPTV
jgi:hypothetical protein